ncbi:uncharacterized protein N7477_007647 [Penicillium maclennaniae]|uniref:uncharacterized protein n=1 Tax=Penicillium maclennaniae TaxID=1343394 RepID=UPI002540DD21|nr:uncharacterized protein N7477_007647 [Penicillium maclennaniae]KAJ5665199.1 hypothetical protein N7477_007647 [Penicillium maclennaniae]
MSSPFDPSDDPSDSAEQFGAPTDDGLDGYYSMMADYPEALDYYALLGLSSDPPPKETDIRSAYRSLTLSFHPDKQPPHLREAAQQHFTRIQEAYDVLIDPKKRIVYDLAGEEAVRQEWGQHGAMGPRGDAQSKQLGVKAMSPDDFRKWFLKTMKKRERKAVESLVSSRGTITLGINASSTISVDEEDGDVTFQIPSANLSTYAVNYSFRTPLHLPALSQGTKDEGETEKPDSEATSDDLDDDSDPIEMTINMGIAGKLARPGQKLQVEYEDKSTEEQLVPLPHVLVAQNISLGATVTPNMRDSTVRVEAGVFPIPSLKTTVGHAFQPISGIKPISVSASSTITRSLWESLPSLDVQATKQVAQRKIAFLTWSSGLMEWPGLLQETFPSLGMSLGSYYNTGVSDSTVQIGLISQPKQPSRMTELDEDNDDDGDDDELREQLEKQQEIDRAAEFWQTYLTATPAGGGIGLTYSRNLFSGKPADDPVRSEWSGEGYFPMAKMEEPRAVRLEISTVLNADMSISWGIKGTRRVGEYTKMSLGVGLTQHGIIATVSWNRLGQGIKLPIVICPAQQANHDAAALAAVFPWIAYCAVEFGFIRPRDRKRRRQAVARRHKELKKLIPKKREESEQAIELMFDQVQRRQAREEAQDGLVIRKAEYGYIPPKDKKPKNGFSEPRVIDVTVPVAALVDRSQLVIPQNSIKFQIIGFHDPAPLLPKRLKIWYTFRGRNHYVEVGDKERVSCPMRSHLTSE